MWVEVRRCIAEPPRSRAVTDDLLLEDGYRRARRAGVPSLKGGEAHRVMNEHAFPETGALEVAGWPALAPGSTGPGGRSDPAQHLPMGVRKDARGSDGGARGGTRRGRAEGRARAVPKRGRRPTRRSRASCCGGAPSRCPLRSRDLSVTDRTRSGVRRRRWWLAAAVSAGSVADFLRRLHESGNS